MSTTSSSSILELVGKLAVTIAIMFIGVLARGYVTSILWSWFIVTTFHATPIGVWASAGLATTTSFFITDFSKVVKDAKDDGDNWASSTYRSLGVIFGVYPLCLGVSWLIHLAV